MTADSESHFAIVPLRTMWVESPLPTALSNATISLDLSKVWDKKGLIALDAIA
jgi:hypothetical protein